MYVNVNTHQDAWKYQAYRNGARLRMCFAADPDEGWAACYRTRPGDTIPLLWKNQNGIRKVKLFGKIELRQETP